MTSYFVTGGTGFIGRRLITRLLARPDCTAVYVLVRSRDRFAAVAGDWDSPKVVPVDGDPTTTDCAASVADVDHVVHLGAVYDLTASIADNQAANVAGTRHVLGVAARVGAVLHHVSSVAVAGDHRGVFTEDSFALGQHLPSPYHATKYAAEELVRSQDVVPWRVYRPSAVVGDSRTGEM